jgi:hypothetical protein
MREKQLLEIRADILRSLSGGRRSYSAALAEYKQSVGFDNRLAEQAFGQLVHDLMDDGLIEWKADPAPPGIIRELWLSERGKAAVESGRS